MAVASTAVTSGLLYRYSEAKTLTWVKKKVYMHTCTVLLFKSSTQVDRLAVTLCEEQVDIGVGSKSLLLKRNTSQRYSDGNGNV